jgi:hypothetical protein
MEKKEVFGVVWIDNMLGPLTLRKPTAEAAREAAATMRERGKDMIRDCRAVHIAAGSDKIQYLD